MTIYRLGLWNQARSKEPLAGSHIRSAPAASVALLTRPLRCAGLTAFPGAVPIIALTLIWVRLKIGSRPLWVRRNESMLELVIDSIRVSLMNYQRVVILRVKDSDRFLPIWIGPNEADAIALKLQDVTVPRPLTHDLLGSVIDTLGATVDHILVSELTDDTFYAKIVLTHNGSKTEVDCRPSDAIALAVRTKAPIYAGDEVLAKASIQMDMESGKPMLPQGEPGSEQRPLREEELKSLSAFTEFIDTLDLEDLGNEGKPPPTESAGPG